jgi:hypothetical protein
MLQQKTRKNIEEKKENKGKKRKQKKQKKNLRRTLTLVVGENSSVKHAFSVSTTATRTTRRIALPHLRPSLSLSLSRRTFPAPSFPLPWFCPLENFTCPL